MPSSPYLHPLPGVLEGQRLLVIPPAPAHHPVLQVRSDPSLPVHKYTVTHTHLSLAVINHHVSVWGRVLLALPSLPLVQTHRRFQVDQADQWHQLVQGGPVHQWAPGKKYIFVNQYVNLLSTYI